MRKGPVRSEALESVWRERIARHESSGQTVRDFCLSENLKESALYYWRRELARRDGQSSGRQARRSRQQPVKRSTSSFLPIAVASTKPAPIEIAMSDSVSIRVAAGCDEWLLKMVVDVLEQR